MASKAAAILFCFLALSSSLVFASETVEAELEQAEIHEEELKAVPSDVLVLDGSNFTDTIKQYDFVLAEFYAPWCGHCKRLAPEYEAAATILKSNDPPIILAKVDCDEASNKESVCSEYNVQGFPTLKMIRNKGEIVNDYSGPRETDGIVSHVKKFTGPPSVELTSADQAKELLAENEKELVIVGVFKTLEGEEYENFIKVAEDLRSVNVFAHTVDASYLPESDVPVKTLSVRLYKDFDDKIADSKDFSPAALKIFIEEESTRLVTEMSMNAEHRAALMKVFDSTKDKVFLFLNGSKEDDEAADVLSGYHKDAKSFKSKNLIFIFAEHDASAQALLYFGINRDDLPACVIQIEKGKKYVKLNLEPEHLAPWLNDFLGGTLKPHIKSAPIPETNDEAVKVVVSDSLQQEVLDAKKDVFLEFYAPWCAHCKELAPILEEVAEIYKEVDPEVVIAKFDATANDVSSDLFSVGGYPTMYFHSASGVVTAYADDQSDEAIIEFINKHKTNRSEESMGIPKAKEPEAEEEAADDEEVIAAEGQSEPADLEEVVETDSVKDEL